MMQNCKSLIGGLVVVLSSVASGEMLTIESGATSNVNSLAELNADGYQFADATGRLVLNLESAPTCPIKGTGTVVKDNDADWEMTTLLSDFTGDYEIKGGLVTVTASKQLGSTSGGAIYVRDGATLTWNGTVDNDHFGSRVIHLAGRGVTRDGREKGALRSTHLRYQYRTVVLDDDALYVQETTDDAYAFHPTCHLGEIILNGHTFTVNERNGKNVYLWGNYIHADATDGGTFQFEDDNGTSRSLFLRDDCALPLAPGQTIMKGKTSLSLSESVPTLYGPLTVDGKLSLGWSANNQDYWRGWAETNYACFAGPITFASADSLISYSDSNTKYYGTNCLHLCGALNGPGTIRFASTTYREDGGLNPHFEPEGRLNIFGVSSADAFTGHVAVSNNLNAATLVAYKTNALPNYGHVHVQNGTIAAGLMPDDVEHRWTEAALAAFNNEVDWGANAYLTLDTTFMSEKTGTLSGPAFDGLVTTPTLRLGHDSDGAAVLTGRFEKPLSLGVFRGALTLGKDFDGTISNGTVAAVGRKSVIFAAGELKLDGAKAVRTGYNGLFVGTEPSRGIYGDTGGNTVPVSHGCLTVTNSTLVTTWYPESGAKTSADQGALRIGWYSYPAKMVIEAGSVISNHFLVGSGYSNMATPHQGGGIGAVYQRGGDVTVIGQDSSSHLSSSIGIQGYGYWGLSGGSLRLTASVNIGGYGIGVLHATGGEITRGANWRGKTGYFLLGGCNSGKSVLWVTNATVQAGTLHMADGDSATAYLTVDAGGRMSATSVDWGKNKTSMGIESDSSSREIVTVRNGGLLEVPHINQARLRAYAAPLIVNVDGGTFQATKDAAYFTQSTKDGVPPTRLRVYKGGMTLDTNGKNLTASAPVLAATGKGVKSIAWEATSGYIGAPCVTITGDGYGAVAVADFDEETGTVKGLVVKSPGWDYTTATASVYQGGVPANVTSIACTLEENDTTGGFTKAGEGTFTTSATNTWGGATVVKGGTFVAGCDWAVPENSAVVLAGGDLDFGGFTGVVSKVTYGAGGGRFLNATNVDLPAAFDLALTTDEIAAGTPIALTGNFDLAGKTLAIDGDVASLDPETRHTLVQTTGALTGLPTVSPDLPTGWKIRTQGQKLILVRPRGLCVIIR